MKRRDAIKGLGALAGTTVAARLLTGCGRDISCNAPRAGITTIVTVMMENRSFDHYLGARKLVESRPVDGLLAAFSNPDRDGETVRVFNDPTEVVPDPPHSWNASRDQFAGGSNSGFVTAYQRSYGGAIPPHVMGYLVREQLPVTWALADAYCVCDAWFSSVMGPTWPNRFYLHSGQSGGRTNNDLPEGGGFKWPSIHGRLSDAGVDWAYYYQDLPVAPLFDDAQVRGHVRRVNYDFWDDAAAGTLPPVVWVEPAFGINDDHPPHAPILGQQFLATVYRALAASPQWENILLVITYDEHGGFYDHVPPPLAADERADEGFDQLGFRVPSLVIGPYVKAGAVSSVVYDHTSVLAQIDRMFGLEPLTVRVAEAADLVDTLDLERLESLAPAPPIELPAVEIEESALPRAADIRSGQPELEALADAGFFATGLDRRHRRLDDARAIGEVLDHLGGGRILTGR